MADIAGELIRENVTEQQQGIPLYLDIQLIDTNTCDILPNIYTDIWHCNSTVSSLSVLFILYVSIISDVTCFRVSTLV